jgi:hypothetical protein
MPALAHIGIDLASKHFTPKTNTFALICAAMVPDIVSLIFLIPFLPAINYTPWSHGLIMDIIWALVAGLITFLISHDRKISLLITLLAFSHWVLDFIGWPMLALGSSFNTGVPLLFDMSYTAGLGLYRTLAGALIFDIGVFMIGLVIYLLSKKKTKNKNSKKEK